jgi:hypothetical protein
LLPSVSPDQGQIPFVSAMRSVGGSVVMTASAITFGPANCLLWSGGGDTRPTANIALSQCSNRYRLERAVAFSHASIPELRFTRLFASTDRRDKTRPWIACSI